ncbi:MAG: hypothetical protein NTX64_04300 [Elusimicrobia bacterium]|nr:hypothetical protein [Elusimicrobiota bacterium]
MRSKSLAAFLTTAVMLAASAFAGSRAASEGAPLVLGKTGWTVIVPSGYERSGWREPSKTAGNGYVNSLPADLGNASCGWVSAGKNRSAGTSLAGVARVEHHIDSSVEALEWKPGKPPPFYDIYCRKTPPGAGRTEPKATLIKGVLYGRMTFSWDCPSGWQRHDIETVDARRGIKNDHGWRGETPSSHFVVVLGTTAWTPHSPLWLMKALEVIHVEYKTEWINVFDRTPLSARSRAAADFHRLCSTLAPPKGHEMNAPASAREPPALLQPGAPPVQVGDLYPWLVTPPEGFPDRSGEEQSIVWRRQGAGGTEIVSVEGDFRNFTVAGTWPVLCRDKPAGRVEECTHLGRRAVRYACDDSAQTQRGGYRLTWHYDVLQSYNPAASGGQVVGLAYETNWVGGAKPSWPAPGKKLEFPPVFEKFCASLTPMQREEPRARTPPAGPPATSQEPETPLPDDAGSRPIPLLR